MPTLDKRREIAEAKMAQVLGEALALELALVQTLSAHIGITPRGEYRKGLERHLAQTRSHAERVERRMSELGGSRNPLVAGFTQAQATLGQALSAAKAPLDAMRGASTAESLLKNAKDEAASEELEIVTYIGIRRFAEAVGDDATARLAASIRADEEQMQTFLHEQVRRLAEATVREEIRGETVFDVTTIGVADAARRLAGRAEDLVDDAEAVAGDGLKRARTTAKTARTGVRRTAGEATSSTRRTRQAASSGTRRTARVAASATRRTAKTAAAGPRKSVKVATRSGSGGSTGKSSTSSR